MAAVLAAECGATTTCRAVDAPAACYDVTEIVADTPPAMEHVAATYIVTMDSSSSRVRNCVAQVKEAWPTRRCFVVVNQGWKKCDKGKDVTSTSQDLLHANNFIFGDARRRFPGAAILVLEDDCTWAPTARTGLRDVDRFVAKHSEADFSYFLGCAPVPFALLPTTTPTTMRVRGIVGGSHAVVHSAARLARPLVAHDHWLDRHLDQQLWRQGNTAYAHWRPLAYQTWPVTANSASWETPAIRGALATLALDRRPEPGTSILYALAYAVPLLLLAVVLLAVPLVRRR